MKREKLLVYYKSGNSIEVTCDSFKVRREGGNIVEVEWKNIRPYPLHIGVDNIEAVFHLNPDA